MSVVQLTSETQAQKWLASLPGYDAAAKARLELFAALMAEENTRQNLVSQASLEHVWVRHIADSAQLLSHVPRETSGAWIDLGTGAGFPGMVVAAIYPEREVLMVESRTRRIDWLERARIALGLKHARIIPQRLELVESRHATVISARAFAPLGRLLDISARFSTSDTIWLLPKGRSAQQELDELHAWRHKFHVEQSVTDPQAGIVVGTIIGRKGKAK